MAYPQDQEVTPDCSMTLGMLKVKTITHTHTHTRTTLSKNKTVRERGECSGVVAV